MDEKKMSIVLEALADTIKELRFELYLANSKIERLEEELEAKGDNNG